MRFWLVIAAAWIVACDDGTPCTRASEIIVDGISMRVCEQPLACGDNVRVSSDVNAPVINNVVLVDQLEQDPWTLVLTLDFRDADGNLAAGDVVFYLNNDGDSATSQSLLPTFKQSAISEEATSGTLVLPLRFDDTVGDGVEIDLGMQLVDAEVLHSNCYGLTLEFEVTGR